MSSIIGFTGTRKGMTIKQLTYIQDFLPREAILSVHHGCCIGADKQFHDICRSLGLFIVGHPPENKKALANVLATCNTIKEFLPYITRNHNIVDSCTLLLATPAQDYEVIRSGTWATIRYAKKKLIPSIIIYPNGNTSNV